MTQLPASQTSYTDPGAAGIISDRTEYTYAVHAVTDGHSELTSDRVKLRRGVTESSTFYVEITVDPHRPP